MADSAVNMPKAGAGQPGLYILIRPREKSYGKIRRVSRAAAWEHTAKDFVDFFGNVDVLAGFGPATEELIEEDGRWRELVAEEYKDLECVREVYSGGKLGQNFLVIFVLEDSEKANLEKWKLLLGKIIGRFF